MSPSIDLEWSRMHDSSTLPLSWLFMHLICYLIVRSYCLNYIHSSSRSQVNFWFSYIRIYIYISCYVYIINMYLKSICNYHKNTITPTNLWCQILRPLTARKRGVWPNLSMTLMGAPLGWVSTSFFTLAFQQVESRGVEKTKEKLRKFWIQQTAVGRKGKNCGCLWVFFVATHLMMFFWIDMIHEDLWVKLPRSTTCHVLNGLMARIRVGVMLDGSAPDFSTKYSTRFKCP